MKICYDLPNRSVFFSCDLPASTGHLHQVTKMELDRRVKECTMALGDSRLLAKLANGGISYDSR